MTNFWRKEWNAKNYDPETREVKTNRRLWVLWITRKLLR